MYKLLSILSLTLLAQFSIAGHHESGHMNKGAVIGYELSDNGEKLDIIAGDPSLVKIWVDYVEAHNQRDLEAIDKTNAEDLVGKAPNGVIVNGSDEHAAFLKNWFETSNPSWEFVYAMANDVPQPDGEIHHWVTSSYKVTDIIDGTEVVARESFDVRIENNKIKEIIVASRQVLAEE
tara:strand:+ start:261 stop:791 length:531 start_codon:yes stop_codon:yes gene_type:complete